MSVITIPVECEKCGEELEVEIQADYNSRVKLLVKPCLACLLVEHECGCEEGRKETDHGTE